jgi:hypothetical protein
MLSRMVASDKHSAVLRTSWNPVPSVRVHTRLLRTCVLSQMESADERCSSWVPQLRADPFTARNASDPTVTHVNEVSSGVTVGVVVAVVVDVVVCEVVVSVGADVGITVGAVDSGTVGLAVGNSVVGDGVGAVVGDCVGDVDGDRLGGCVGEVVGD